MAIAGGLFASLQTYITPDAFTFDLSVLFFIAILIGGRGSILGPMLGTIILTILPEIAANPGIFPPAAELQRLERQDRSAASSPLWWQVAHNLTALLLLGGCATSSDSKSSDTPARKPAAPNVQAA
jgi:ABC-type branched-subunit amino acid transport system permease subunit